MYVHKSVKDIVMDFLDKEYFDICANREDSEQATYQGRNCLHYQVWIQRNVETKREDCSGVADVQIDLNRRCPPRL